MANKKKERKKERRKENSTRHVRIIISKIVFIPLCKALRFPKETKEAEKQQDAEVELVEKL